MNRAIFGLLLVLSLIVAALTVQTRIAPTAVGTAVIGEKPGKTMGNQVAQLLPESLSAKQARLLAKVYAFAKKEGFKNPEIMQSIILQETMAGGMKSYKVANPGPEAYFGIGQLKNKAARDVLRKYPELYVKYDFHTRSDDEIKANLILNDDFNLEVSTKYVKILQDTYGFTGRKLINAYNRGPGGVQSVDDNFHYAVGAEAKLKRYKTNGKVS